MSVIDVDKLLEEISEESPSGDNLEYDPDFVELERATEGKEEQQIGKEVVAAEEPDWGDVKTKAVALLGRTKHLRVAAHLARALLHTDGFTGFHEGLAVLRGLLERYWTTVYPQLDPADRDDPTERVNILTALVDPMTLLHDVQQTVLVRSKNLGQFSLRDIKIATGQLSPADDDAEPADSITIEAAFKDVGTDEIVAIGKAVQGCIDHTRQIERILTDHVGVAKSADLGALPVLLNSVLQEILKRTDDPSAVESLGVGTEVTGMGHAEAAVNVGGIKTRDDVVRTIDLICEYYRRNEPSSPVPLLLKRAKKLVAKDFVEIIHDLTPGGVNEVNTIIGKSSED